MQTDSAPVTQSCWPKLLACLLLAATGGCSRSCPPKIPTVVTVREPCIKEPAPALDSTRDCLGRATSYDDALDCLAQSVFVRDEWIAARIDECGVKQ